MSQCADAVQFKVTQWQHKWSCWDCLPKVVISCQNANGLQRFSKTHVITQDPVQLVLVKEGQPVHSVLQDETEQH